MKKRPSYALTSVDNALLLLLMLRDQGTVRVSEAAEELGIARSTAHRLLSMLVYRDFAIQDDRRSYAPGPALAGQAPEQPNQQLRTLLYPHMDALCERVQETVNLMLRVGTQTRFIATVESTQVLHVGDRRGTILPAHRSSGGKALLAELDRSQLEQLYRAEDSDRALPDREWKTLLRELKSIRESGYALNQEKTEDGVSALGMCVHGGTGQALGALSIAAPSARFRTDLIPGMVREMRTAVTRAEADVQTLTLP
ncbi:helix-turn-helix domain-containing protein [Allosaccharopolyspora coralli]|uniref:Helix-turn-helix domain-containing protein n=1 Tax=Allosaccharopolyspora coralli TaxID=2665642 RepID=A0A5Q3QFJ9_9PSEU|nr:IclR family transcriptional regulator [Allosaccharopolyspora coralli]QGK69597.1 helix-turn-helix domain-containing protein [Allosaccharopolyspora coralli]